MTFPPKIRSALLLTDVLQGLSAEDARSVRITNWAQLTFFALMMLLWPQVILVEPPETLAFSTFLFWEMVAFGAAGRVCLHKRRILLGASLTLIGLNIHIVGLCVAYADDPAHLVLSIPILMPFLCIPSRFRVVRWSFAILPSLFFLADQFYYRTLGGSGIFGPPKWIVAPDYLMPPLVLGMIFFLLLLRAFVKAVGDAESALAKEHAASERLLLNILPGEIAAELKVSGRSKPRYFANTTVCFTDFVGFTRISESMAPEELVAELDRCFSYFDSVIGRNKLEKLKTIGDSYMFAGGVPIPSATHAVDCVMAALEIQAFMNQMKEIKKEQGLPYWELRLGIHSGDLVAGVIGERKFAYDVWSDTVNTASRCESSGVSGKINISKAAYELVKDFFQCDFRGSVPAKHKGEIEMYFVNGLLPDLAKVNEPRTPNTLFAERYREIQRRSA